MTIIYVKDGETFYIEKVSDVVIRSNKERSLECHSEEDNIAYFHIKESIE